ncbi:hypothetical protein AB4Y43_18315 [Paraburkholderia sp. BR10872]|uniref:hypothetical protein n=1 Tax=Paraburkholderia sp. BR10872 TaxID=3236989 RepID=UPI0034D1CBDF
MSEMIWHLIKFFNKKQYADDFIKGKLHLKRLGYFRNLESGKSDGRPDANEALSHWLQPDGLRIKFSVPGIGETEITHADLAAPVSMSVDYHNHLHIFCLYAVHTTGFDLTDGKIDCAEDEVTELERQLRIDSRNLEFGEYAVITPAPVFLDRMKNHLQTRGDYFRGRLVEYYDDKTFNGEIPIREIPFWKQKHFSYQNEFRICIDSKTAGDNPLNLEIGNISDICALINSSELNDLLKLQVSTSDSLGNINEDQ